MTRTWDSTMSMIPKGGDTIWGGLDWGPEEGYKCNSKKQKEGETQVSVDSGSDIKDVKNSTANYGRIVSFGKDVAEAASSDVERVEFRVSLSFLSFECCVQKSIVMCLPDNIS